MVTIGSLKFSLVSVILLWYGPATIHSYDGTVDEDGPWSYNDIDGWGVDHPICNSGQRQSPIALSIFHSRVSKLSPITFQSYDDPLRGPLLLNNDGHSVGFDIPETEWNGRPTIAGGILQDSYAAIGLHFHWGSKYDSGSEHTINGLRYDTELHIVHRNTKYSDTPTALANSDGIAVLAIMLDIVRTPLWSYSGIDQLFDKLPSVTTYNAVETIEGSMTLSQFIGSINTRQFYTYNGSLTTPPCSEAVTFIVFPEPLRIVQDKMKLFWNIKDRAGNPLLNNFRPLQDRNNRRVHFDPTILPWS